MPDENCQSAIETLQTKFFAFYCHYQREYVHTKGILEVTFHYVTPKVHDDIIC